MCRIILHGQIANVLEFIHPVYSFLKDVIKNNRLSILSLVLYPSLDALLLLLLDLVKFFNQDGAFFGALEVDILPVLLLSMI